ncbi:hypothetical protein HanIR_Chr11g0550271 [Helianthus annuus]|nr:hypothetical protein HanIR_Chr11g0550271 [Helianthus annuus]
MAASRDERGTGTGTEKCSVLYRHRTGVVLVFEGKIRYFSGAELKVPVPTRPKTGYRIQIRKIRYM